MKTNILINNELLQGDSTPEKIINPVNSELIVEVLQSSEEQVNKAVAAARVPNIIAAIVEITAT